MEAIKLTQYSHGAGCGCKISPAILDEILHSTEVRTHFPSLLVGNESKDDAAVFDLGSGQCVISTTDFFMPVVDDPATFGAIASVNAISDVYAMGGTPMMAIAILGWPVDKIAAPYARQVIEGARAVCERAKIPLAGGHSIDCPEPVFGLAVTGLVNKDQVKRNDTARQNSLLYLTKPLGVGIITTAQKKGVVKDDHYQVAIDTMLRLNDFGAALATRKEVNALTDVTGFGLLGHLREVCNGSGLSAQIRIEDIPRFKFVDEYVNMQCIPGGTHRNWKSYGDEVKLSGDDQKFLLADPQTSGGLLISVDAESQAEFEHFALQQKHTLKPFGKLKEKGKFAIEVA